MTLVPAPVRQHSVELKGNFPIKVQIRVERNAMKNTPHHADIRRKKSVLVDVLPGTPGHKELYSAVLRWA
jgi:hypothetical protein